MSGIYVVVADEDGVSALTDRAEGLRSEGSAVQVVCLGRRGLEAARSSNADGVVVLDAGDDDLRAEAYVPALTALLVDRGPELVLLDATVSGWEIAAGVASGLGVGLVGDATSLSREGESWRAARIVFAGAAVETLAWDGPGVVTVAPGGQSAGPVHPEEGRAAPAVEERVVDADHRVRTVARTTRVVDTVDLAGAARVVCVGMGVATLADLDNARRLASAIGAELACTRPVAEDREWLPATRYLGISGATVHGDLYLGLGVSGQVQHTVGMRESRVVVGIDTNADAPLLAQSDLAVVADVNELLPILLAALDPASVGAR